MYAMKVMTRPVVTVPADATVWAAADILWARASAPRRWSTPTAA